MRIWCLKVSYDGRASFGVGGKTPRERLEMYNFHGKGSSNSKWKSHSWSFRKYYFREYFTSCKNWSWYYFTWFFDTFCKMFWYINENKNYLIVLSLKLLLFIHMYTAKIFYRRSRATGKPGRLRRVEILAILSSIK